MKINEIQKLEIGLERQMDNLGRVVIPKEMRDKLNFKSNQLVNIKLLNNRIEISKSKNVCLFCNGENDIIYYNKYSICESCLQDIIKIFSE